MNRRTLRLLPPGTIGSELKIGYDGTTQQHTSSNRMPSAERSERCWAPPFERILTCRLLSQILKLFILEN
jgi:hypothetical protein